MDVARTFATRTKAAVGSWLLSGDFCPRQAAQRPEGRAYSGEAGGVWRYQASCSLVASRRPSRDQ